MAEELQSAVRVVQAIEHIGTAGPVRLNELAMALGVHKSNAQRMLVRLRALDWVTLDDTGTLYQLGPALLQVGHAAMEQTRIEPLLRVAKSICDLTEESVHVAVPHENHMLLVARVDSPHALRVSCELFSRDPLHTSSLGKAYLASLSREDFDRRLRTLRLPRLTPNTITTKRELRADTERARARGYAIDDGEGRAGVRCMGVSVRSMGTLRAPSLSVTGPSDRWTLEDIERLAPTILELVDPLAITVPTDRPRAQADERRATMPAG